MSDKNSTQGADSPPPAGASKATPEGAESKEQAKPTPDGAKSKNQAKPTPAGAKPADTKSTGAKAQPKPAGPDTPAAKEKPAGPADAEAKAKPTPAAPAASENPGETPGETPGAAPAATPGAAALPDLEAHTEAPEWLSGGEDHDGHIWDGAFEAESKSGQAAASEPAPSESDPAPTAEPEVTNPDDVTLETPSLGDADISSDAAEAASLNDATAEVKEVEAQAADAAVLTDPAANHPAAVNRTEGIAAAAPMTGDSPRTGDPEAGDARSGEPKAGDAGDSEGAGDAKDSDTAKSGSDTAEPGKTSAGTDSDEPSETAAPKTAAAAEPTESRRSRRESEPPSESGNGRNKRLLLIIGILGVLAVMVVLLFTVVLGSEKEPGVLEEDVAPIELESGACLSDFTGVNDPTTVVTCDTPHNAQLVATASYDDDDEFPGSDALTERADEVCAGVRYAESAAENSDLDLQVNKAVPTPASWEDGDRRVDCFVVAGEGRELTESLIEP